MEHIDIKTLEWVKIPFGTTSLVQVNSNSKKLQEVYYVSEFEILKYPITNQQYQIFVNAPDGYARSTWWEFSSDAIEWRSNNPLPFPPVYPADELPRTNVSWYEAVAFSHWLSALLGKEISLPSVAQWQRAAHGETNRYYPWGNVFDEGKCVFHDYEPKNVQDDIAGSSPYLVMGMSGNVWEWCLNSWDEDSNWHHKVIKGGSFQEYDSSKLQISSRD